MGLRNLTSWNEPIFRKKSRAVEKFDERLWTLLNHFDGIMFIDKIRKD